MIEDTIDAVIGAGWRVLETDFSESAFEEWRKQALDCVVALCGESHPYTQYFKKGVQKARTSSVLTGVGLLTAAQSREGKEKPFNGTVNGCNGSFEDAYGAVARNRGGSLGGVAVS